MPIFSSPPSRIGFRKKTGEAELSPMMPAVDGVLPVAVLASSRIAGTAPEDCRLATGEVWKTYLKPRSVMLSANESVSHGICARSVTSVTASVKVLSHAPVPPTRSGSCAVSRCAAFFAFSAESPASATTSLRRAPPSALMPPFWLISSTAISAPIWINWPCRAHGPEIGAMTATLTSFACAHDAVANAAAAAAIAAASAARRPTLKRSFFGHMTSSFGCTPRESRSRPRAPSRETSNFHLPFTSRDTRASRAHPPSARCVSPA